MVKPQDNPHSTRVLILTGMSGGGKTVALRALEDLDYYCVDNLPTALISSLIRETAHGRNDNRRSIAVGVDIRNRAEDLEHMPSVLSQLAAENVEVQLLFLDSRDDVLIKRYSESRRRHPLSSGGVRLPDAITRERRLLRSLASIAERVIDTSELNVHQLRRLIATEIGRDTEQTIVLFESFAYRRGLPMDADFVFDARCLPNPHWDPKLRPLSGKDPAVREFFAQQPMMQEFQDNVAAFLHQWLPRFEQDKRGYVTVCIGCTGGRHRSVYLAERLADQFREDHKQVLSYHRELE